jgi:hypothetical protein
MSLEGIRSGPLNTPESETSKTPEILELSIYDDIRKIQDEIRSKLRKGNVPGYAEIDLEGLEIQPGMSVEEREETIARNHKIYNNVFFRLGLTGDTIPPKIQHTEVKWTLDEGDKLKSRCTRVDKYVAIMEHIYLGQGDTPLQIRPQAWVISRHAYYQFLAKYPTKVTSSEQ